MESIPSRISPGISYVTLPYSGDPRLKDYFGLRASVYAQYGMDYYKPEPDGYDTHPDTRFILVSRETSEKRGAESHAAGSHTEILGGRRILIHRPGTDTKLKTDETILIPIAQMLSHLDLSGLHYAELTSLTLSDSLRGSGIAAEFYDVSFDYCKNARMDFIVVEAVPTNIRAFVAAATRAGCPQIIPRPEARSIDGDEDFRIFASPKSEAQLPLLTEEQKRAGIGSMLTDAAIDELIRYRETLKAARKKS